MPPQNLTISRENTLQLCSFYFGSHNFSELGGLFQTEEISLHITDSRIAAKFIKFVEKYIRLKS